MPRFSIVIPTRDRPETLKHALRSCLDQDFEDYEIVVFDNSSVAPCAEVVSQVAGEFPGRIVRYEKAKQPLAMTHSWENALELAQGEHVSILGDDDGLIRGGLRFAQEMLRRHPSKVIRFAQVAYGWPDHPVAELQHHLLLPMQPYLRCVDGKRALVEVMSMRTGYFGLPMIYNSLVHHDVIGSVRERIGRVFVSLSPDIASGITFAYSGESYLSCGVPIVIRGGSGRSNGVANIADCRKDGDKVQEAIRSDFEQLNEEAGLGWNRELPEIQMLPFVVADCFLTVKRALFPKDDTMRLNVPALVNATALNLLKRRFAADHEYWRKLASYARQHGCRLPEMPARSNQSGETGSTGKIQPDFGWDAFGGKLGLDASRLGIANVHDAARFAGDFYQYDEMVKRVQLETTRQAATHAAKAFVRILATRNRLRPWEVEL